MSEDDVFILFESELREVHDYILGPEQGMLALLKKKGAPVVGLVYLKADTIRYMWSRVDDVYRNQIAFKVNKRTPKTPEEEEE